MGKFRTAVKTVTNVAAKTIGTVTGTSSGGFTLGIGYAKLEDGRTCYFHIDESKLDWSRITCNADKVAQLALVTTAICDGPADLAGRTLIRISGTGSSAIWRPV